MAASLRISQLTKTVHREKYPAIEPTKPADSATGKAVVISGGTTDVSFAVARGFAAAGASAVVLLARRQVVLKESATKLRAEFAATNVWTESAGLKLQREDHNDLQRHPNQTQQRQRYRCVGPQRRELRARPALARVLAHRPPRRLRHQRLRQPERRAHTSRSRTSGARPGFRSSTGRDTARSVGRKSSSVSRPSWRTS
ncbi:hypothetical protein B0J12DRAFT_404748 [Macrophomina phaseolina]|uniref:Short-chain dehydrogenase/reductase SDR n=1 Tax=Macrophomina phaseolina TaxID=35725 RepID=A0ABQ8GLE3_9PEZI|nr:hypothetical protein B0J12DRAFT_404748 [Macrophomina phaseolina]